MKKQYYVEVEGKNGKYYDSHKSAWAACVEANRNGDEVYMSSYHDGELTYHCYSGEKSEKTAWRD